VHLDDLASKAAFLHDMRQQLSHLTNLAIAGKTSALDDLEDALLADYHLLMNRLPPQCRAVAKLDRIGVLR
jgi:hypothetical protein